MSSTEWDEPREDEIEDHEPPPGVEDAEPSEEREGTAEGGWSNMAEEGGASGPALGATPPFADEPEGHPVDPDR